MQRPCQMCGQPFESRRSDAKFCRATCRSRAQKARQSGIAVTPPSVAPSNTYTPGVLADATRAELGPLADTADGILLLTLAARIDSVPETAPALASLSKEFAARKSALMTHRVTAVSPMDELKARRDARRTA